MTEETGKIGYLTNDEGGKSNMRLCTLIGNLFIIPVMMLTWCWVSITNDTLASFDFYEVLLIFAINVPKVAQKALEVYGKTKGV